MTRLLLHDPVEFSKCGVELVERLQHGGAQHAHVDRRFRVPAPALQRCLR
jgi:hypothetical protein